MQKPTLQQPESFLWEAAEILGGRGGRRSVGLGCLGVFLVAAVLALGGCVAAFVPSDLALVRADYGQKPTNYKAVIEEEVRRTLIDPEYALSSITAFYKNSVPAKDWYHKKAVIEEEIRRTLIDPESARFYNYSVPTKDWYDKDQFGWLVCVDVNGKNSYGEYTERTRYFFMMRGDDIVYKKTNGGTRKDGYDLFAGGIYFEARPVVLFDFPCKY